MNGDSLIAEKYKAVSQIAQMRKTGAITDAGKSLSKNVPSASKLIIHFRPAHLNSAVATTTNQANPAGGASQPGNQSSMTEFQKDSEPPSNQIESVPAYRDVRLSSSEQDETLLHLAEYLLKQNLTQFA